MDFFLALPFKYGLDRDFYLDRDFKHAKFCAMACITLFIILFASLRALRHHHYPIRKKKMDIRVVSMKYLSIMTIDFEPVDIGFKLKSHMLRAI